VVQRVSDDRHGEENPIFQVALVPESNPLQALDAGQMRWEPLIFSPDGAVEGTAKFDLSLVLEKIEGRLCGHLEYAVNRFEHYDVAWLAERFARLIQGIVQTPDAVVWTLPILSATEIKRVLVDWNATAATLPDNVTVPQLFEAQAALTPKALAAVDDDETITYRDLNAQANRVARRCCCAMANRKARGLSHMWWRARQSPSEICARLAAGMASRLHGSALLCHSRPTAENTGRQGGPSSALGLDSGRSAPRDRIRGPVYCDRAADRRNLEQTPGRIASRDP
jgi:hypothetical protein